MAYTKLLLHFNGEDGATETVDSSLSGHSVTLLGSAHLDTDQKKFGSASLRVPGENDYVIVPESEDWRFGTEPFTIDYWVQDFDGWSSFHFLLYFYNYDDCFRLEWYPPYCQGYFICSLKIDGSYKFGYYFGKYQGIDLADGDWHHIALVRKGGDLKLFHNGEETNAEVFQALEETQEIPPFDCPFRIFAKSTGGWMDEFRVSKGIARWWDSNFTPPTKEYPPADRIVMSIGDPAKVMGIPAANIAKVMGI